MGCVCFPFAKKIPKEYDNIDDHPTINGTPMEGDKTSVDYGFINEEFCEALQVKDTASGSIASFPDGAERDAISVVADIEPVQDLNGYTSPWISSDHNKTPYNFRATSDNGGIDVGNTEIDKVIGGTIAWNQLVHNGDFDNITGWNHSASSITANDNVLTATLTSISSAAQISRSNYIQINGHKYLDSVYLYSPKQTRARLQYTGIANGTKLVTVPANTWTCVDCIVSAIGTNGILCYYDTNAELAVGDELKFKNFMSFDLTQMFGSTIADYLYNLEQNTPGAGVAWFRNLFPKAYYEYNSGELMSVNTSEHVMTGKNIIDKSTVKMHNNTNARFSAFGVANWSDNKADGSLILPSGSYTCKLFGSTAPQSIKVIDANGTQIDLVYNSFLLTFSIAKTGAYAIYISFADSISWNNYNIQLELGSTATAYEPYSATSYPLDESLELRGLPKLDTSNKLYYDGDIYAPSGTVTRKYGIVDLGTLTWSKWSNSYHGFYAPVSGSKGIENGLISNSICDKYTSATYSTIVNGNVDKSHNISNNTHIIYINDSDYQSSDATAFKTAMSGVYLVYELATPTTETADAYTASQPIDPDGTEAYTDYAQSQGTRDVAIPVGHDSVYANICPITGGTGVNVTRIGKNFYSPTQETTTKNDVTCTNNGDGTYTIIGRASAQTDFYFSDYVEIPDGNYKFNGISNGSTSTYRIYLVTKTSGDSPSYYYKGISGGDGSATLSSQSACMFFRVYSGVTINVTVSPMIRLSSDTDDTFEQYSGTTYTVSWSDTAGTVYSGTIDVVSGVLTVTHAGVDLGTLTWIYQSSYGGWFKSTSINTLVKYGTWISSCYHSLTTNSNNITNQDGFFGININSSGNAVTGAAAVGDVIIKDTAYTTSSDLVTFLSGETMLYPLATPQTYQLTPTEVELLLGHNNVWADTGDVTVHYYADKKLYIDKIIGG